MEVRGDQCGRKHRDGDTGSDNCIERSVGGPSPDRRGWQQCRWSRILLDRNNWRDETIPPARNGLDKAWLCGGIIENLTDFFIAVPKLWSKSTNVSAGQSFVQISSRVTSSPGRCRSMASNWNGWDCNRIRVPFFLNSPDCNRSEE